MPLEASNWSVWFSLAGFDGGWSEMAGVCGSPHLSNQL
jgi:hypothetical protein